MLIIYSVVFSIAVVKFIEVYCLYDVLLLLHDRYNCISVMFRVPHTNYNVGILNLHDCDLFWK